MTTSALLVPNVSTDLVSVILGGGGVAFLYALGQGIAWLLNRASAKEDKIDRQNRDYQRTLRSRLRYEAAMHDYYRNIANRQEGVIIRELGESKLPAKGRAPRMPTEEDDEDDKKAIKP